MPRATTRMIVEKFPNLAPAQGMESGELSLPLLTATTTVPCTMSNLDFVKNSFSFNLRTPVVVYSTAALQCLLLERPRCCGCGCCYWCCCCKCCCCACETCKIRWRVASVLLLCCPSSPPSLSPIFSLSPFPPGLSDPLSVADLFGRLRGCLPDSASSSGAAHVWSVVNTDPPRVLPPRHVSVRHLALIVH